MSDIRKVALNSYKYEGLSLDELNDIAKRFDDLTDDELKKELESIESQYCIYNSSSVAHYRIAINLYNLIIKRHKLRKDIIINNL